MTCSETAAVWLPLREEDGLEALRIARICVKEWLRSGRLPPGEPHRSVLRQPAGARVVLRLGDSVRAAVRNCGATPLFRAVAEVAIAAATSEPPLTLDDVRNARFEVAVFGAPVAVASHEDVPPSCGVFVADDAAAGLALPGEAAAGGERCEAACRAAGLSCGLVGPEALLYSVADAQVFAE